MRALIALTLLALVTAAAAAQEAPPPAPDGRYVLQPLPDGVVRLDTRTGALTQCRREGADLVCRAVADERRAAEDEVERLARENAALRARVAELERRQGDRSESRPRLPSEREIDEMVETMDTFLRRMWTRMEGWIRRGEPAPQR